MIKIEVLNGTGKNGIASSVSDYLTSHEYKVSKIGDATLTNKTVVYDYSNGKYKSAAQDIATKLNASLSTKEKTTTQTDIQVIVGSDYLK